MTEILMLTEAEVQTIEARLCMIADKTSRPTTTMDFAREFHRALVAKARGDLTECDRCAGSGYVYANGEPGAVRW